MSKSIIDRPSWSDIEHGCYAIVRFFESIDYKPDVIVHLQRGALPIAGIISNLLEVGKHNVYGVSYSSPRGNGTSFSTTFYDCVNTSNKIIPLFQKHGPKILVLEDICDTGFTLSDVNAFYAQHEQNFKTACLYYKENAVYQPHLWWQKIPTDGPYIVFPWEQG